jgi:outer membrane protein assembly factor BamB
VYAQPLFIDGMGGQDLVIVATEWDNVYAFDGATGAQVWTQTLGTPVPLASLPCGNIDPYGVTGTPVVDFASRTVFMDAEITTDGGMTNQHQVFALDVDTGAIKPGWPVEMNTMAKSGNTTFDALHQGQRGALALFNGTLYVPFGGRYGDCPVYHGWVVAIDTANPTQVTAWATTANAGGTWAPGGVSTDGTNLFISTGNTQSTTVWGGGDAVIRLSPGMPPAMSAYFAPMNWHDLDDFDQDLGSAPIVFDLPGSSPGALAIAFGKDGNAYLVDRNNLPGIGTPLGQLDVATDEIISAPVLYTTATATYVAARANGRICTSGQGDLFTVKIVPGSPPTLAASWCATGGAGAPMVTTSDGHSDAIVWTLGAESDNHLHAFDGDTGAAIPFTDSNLNVPGLRRYNTPIAAKGALYVPVDGGVVLFRP